MTQNKPISPDALQALAAVLRLAEAQDDGDISQDECDRAHDAARAHFGEAGMEYLARHFQGFGTPDITRAAGDPALIAWIAQRMLTAPPIPPAKERDNPHWGVGFAVFYTVAAPDQQAAIATVDRFLGHAHASGLTVTHLSGYSVFPSTAPRAAAPH
jgi:hypothetical protein